VSVGLRYRQCLFWSRITFDPQGTQGSGELFLPNGQNRTLRLACFTSADLLALLCQMFHQHTSTTQWRVLQQQALDELHAQRDLGDGLRTLFKRLLEEQRAGDRLEAAADDD